MFLIFALIINLYINIQDKCLQNNGWSIGMHSVVCRWSRSSCSCLAAFRVSAAWHRLAMMDRQWRIPSAHPNDPRHDGLKTLGPHPPLITSGKSIWQLWYLWIVYKKKSSVPASVIQTFYVHLITLFFAWTVSIVSLSID